METIRKSVKSKTNDIDEKKGIVTLAVNIIGVVDSQKDMSMPGCFNQACKPENFQRVKHLYNHDTTQLLGCPLEGKEENGALVVTSQLNLKKQLGRDVLADYLLYAENGKTLEHSIGVSAVKGKYSYENGIRKVNEWKLYEFSTLAFLGACPGTGLLNVKSATPDEAAAAIEFIKKAMKQHGYSDERLSKYDEEMSTLLKAINGGRIVKCPVCGEEFDFDQVEHHTFTDQVLALAAQYQRWIVEDTVREEMYNLAPEIRSQVLAVLDQCKADELNLSEKAITDIMEYAYCPKCWSRVYATNMLVQTASTVEEKQDDSTSTTPETEDPKEEKAAVSTLDVLAGMYHSTN